MIYVIRPQGWGFKKLSSWLYQVSLYTIATVLSSGITGLLFGWLGSVLRLKDITYGLLFVGVVALLYGLKELGYIKLPMPQRKWQVPISWIIERKYIGSFTYGLTIGAGYLTYITHSGFYIWTLLSFFLGSPYIGLIIGGIYGLGRSIPLIIGGIYIQKNNTNVAAFSQLVFVKGRLWHKISSILLLSSGIMLIVY